MNAFLRPLDALLAQRYEYLTEGLIRYRLAFPEMWTLLAPFEGERFVYALLRAKDASAPYPAKFGFLSREENRTLTRHVDLHVVQVWPRPRVTIGSAGGGRMRVVGEDRPAEKIDVVLRRVGEAQLWWTPKAAPVPGGLRVGLIWEAFLDIEQPDLLAFLWDACEALLEAEGATVCYTTHSDPAFAPDAYRRLLRRRDYRIIDRAGQAGFSEQAGFSGRALCAVKML